MRPIKYISPTSLMIFNRDPELFYRLYLSENPIPRAEATIPMQVGSVFDIEVKNALSRDLGMSYYLEHKDTHTVAYDAGFHVADTYMKCGAYERLLNDLKSAKAPPCFEDKIIGDVEIGGEIIRIGGLPDMYYNDAAGFPVILDWKVNGYFSNYNKSPHKGWIRLYAEKEGKWEEKYLHKKATTMTLGSTEVLTSFHLEQVYLDWATQLTMYSWVLGFRVFLPRVEQIVAKPSVAERFDFNNPESLRARPRPILRVASHCSLPSKDFQERLTKQILDLHYRIKENWFFPHLTKEESISKCQLLDETEPETPQGRLVLAEIESLYE